MQQPVVNVIKKPLDPDGYLHEVLLGFVQGAMNTEAKHQEVLRDDAFEGDTSISVGAIDLADADRRLSCSLPDFSSLERGNC